MRKDALVNHFFVACFLFLFNSQFALAQEVQSQQGDDNPPPAPANIEELLNEIETLREFHAIPGISLAIINNNETVYQGALGLANQELAQDADQDTLFRIGSVSKMFVGIAALQLVEQGKLDLQTPVKDLAPDIAFTNPYSASHPVRVIHLLQHTAGWDDIHLVEFAQNDPTPVTLKQALDFHPKSRISRWPPGERMSYSNSGHAVVAYIIQKITSMDFEDYVKEHIFSSLGMQTATYRQVNDGSAATLYANKQPVEYWHIGLRPSGAVNASAVDMANFLSFLVNGKSAIERPVITPNSLRLMETPASTLAAKAGMRSGYGIANYTSFSHGLMLHGHNGGVNGGLSELVYSHEHGVGYYIAINSDAFMGLSEVAAVIKDYLLDSIASPAPPKAHTINSDAAQRYSGYYMPTNPRQEMTRFVEQVTGVIKVQLKEDTLQSGSFSYVAVTDQLFRKSENAVANVALLEDANGEAIQIGAQHFQKISPLRHYLQQFFLWALLAFVGLHLLWFFWWMGRRYLGKSTGSASLQIKLWPFLASLSLFVFFIAMIFAQMNDVLTLLGNPSVASITMMLATYGFAVASVIALVQNVRLFKKDTHWFSKYACLFSSAVFFVCTIYFAYFGVIGLRTFA
ncbi:beta-lactamase family protein [Glaciecola sp. XM2]|uniref:serine hydrolase domain-containing protein n=1 Tax=Glaciecola sp. XM2 TaxID=1914931 RepID=UPI001BDF0A13|nr:serine hydrolase domain-containing protein [Glaciecola sp. XM2]MBT1451408.1 beta-lactamase family protein [Glaciecola sp. XM2]